MSDLAPDAGRPATARMALQARNHLLEEIIPFWFPQAIDRELGGYYTCFDNRGRFVSDAKYTWSQGRFVAVCSSLAQAARDGLLPLDAEAMLADARRGAEFVRDHAVLPDYTTRYVLDRFGRPTDESVSSFYADCFAVIGFAGLARVAGEAEWYELADRIRLAAWDTASRADIPTAPYQMPSGTRPFGVSMILLNVELDMAAARVALGLAPGDDRLQRAMDDVMAFSGPDKLFTEVVGADLDPATLVARHRTPGHGLEGLWMLAAAAGDGRKDFADTLVEHAIALCELGWDEEFGGLLRYTDSNGGEPRGRLLGLPYEELVATTWTTKLWWVHSEAAYTTALLAERTGDARLAEWGDRIWEYTRTTFPAQGEGEEWIQIRDRAGRPLDRVVALPLKDPYHLIRNLLQITALGQPATT